MSDTSQQANTLTGQDVARMGQPPPDAPQDNAQENSGKALDRGFDLLAYLKNKTAFAWSKAACFSWLRTALLVLVLGMLFKISGSDPMIWWRKIYEPEGWIFVDSPEVYTRERLLNERLDEDIWLAARLKEADSEENLTSLKRLIKRRLSVGHSKDEPPNEQGGTTDPKPGTTEATGAESVSEEAELTFDQKVKIKSANRDFILKRIIENRLDDRHDLEGNSLYILKFDTTIITNQVSNRRAMVEVRVRPPVEFPAEDLDLDFGEIPLAIALTDEKSLAFIRRSFLQFIQDTSDRLNNAVAKAYARGTDGCKMAVDDCIKKYAALSFGVIEKDIGVRS